jgi:tetratricopeptide (TPR) repeat protein
VLSDVAASYMALAVQADTAGVVPDSAGASRERAVAVGRELLVLVFGARQPDVAVLDGRPELPLRSEDPEATEELSGAVADIFEADPELESAAAGVLSAFFRQEFAAGNTQAMVKLGDLLRHQDKDGEARDAYRQAAEAGDTRALTALGKQFWHLGEFGAARTVFGQAVDSGDPDVVGEALIELARLLKGSLADYTAARAAYLQAVATGHPRWAPTAKLCLAGLTAYQGDLDGARRVFEEMMDHESPYWAECAAVTLASILNHRGDTAGEKAAYWRAVNSGTGKWAAHALVNLVHILTWADHDLEGVRAVYRRGVETGNPDAPVALVSIGHMLRDRGDDDGARAAFAQARADGVDPFLLPDDL